MLLKGVRISKLYRISATIQGGSFPGKFELKLQVNERP